MTTPLPDSPTPPSSPPLIEGFPLGPWQTNGYLVRVPPGEAPAHPGVDPCWIVDPGLQPAPLIERVRALHLHPQAILLTHAHLDHIAGVSDVLSAFPGTPVHLHDAEAHWLADPVLNLSETFAFPITAPGPDRPLRDGQELHLADSRWRVFHTPGHSPGSVTIYNPDHRVALVGDLIMAGTVGRTDFPGSDANTLVQSIRRRIYTLPDDTKLYPGHGPPTTVARERRSNAFVRAD